MFHYLKNTILQPYAYIKDTLQDLYALQQNPEKMIAETLYSRALMNNNIASVATAPAWFSYLTQGWKPSQIYVITGDKYNVMEVGAYGEANHDPAARAPFDFVSVLFSRRTVLNEFRVEAGHEKGMLRKHLITDALPNAHDVASRRFKDIIRNWNTDKRYTSFQTQMTYVAANVIGECVFGIPELPICYIPGLIELNKYVLEPVKASEKLNDCAQFLRKMHRDIVADQKDQILSHKKFVYEDLMLPENATQEEMTEKLIEKNVSSFYIVESNVSSVIMGGIAQINQNREIKEKLWQEVADYKQANNLSESEELPLEALRSLPYLNCVYLETLRLMASVPNLARQTSIPTTLNIRDQDGVPHEHKLARHSYLFFDLRSQHHDPRLWPEPDTFNPERFRVDLPKEPGKPKQNDKQNLVPFSVGKRACPAQHGFVEVVFKTIMVESLQTKFTFDQPIEKVPGHSMKPYWRKEYLADIQNENFAQKRLSFS